MVKGILTINLDPSYIAFTETVSDTEVRSTLQTLRFCSLNDIESILIELEIIPSGNRWQPKDCYLRIPIELAHSHLARVFYSDVRVLDTATSKMKQKLAGKRRIAN